METVKTVTPEMAKALTDMGSNVPAIAQAAASELSKAFTGMIRENVFSGDITAPVFQVEDRSDGKMIEYFTDFSLVGDDATIGAYVSAPMGRIHERLYNADSITVNTHEIASSFEFPKRIAQYGDWNAVRRAMSKLEADFVIKKNYDAFTMLVSAGVTRASVQVDTSTPAGAGKLSKRLITLMENTMRRGKGGNSSSVTRGKLTHMYVSPELLRTVREWTLAGGTGVDSLDDVTRKSIYDMADLDTLKIYGVTLVGIDELGPDGILDTYFTDVLGQSYTNSKTELVIGLDLNKKDTFVSPVRQALEIQEDPTFARRRVISMWGTWDGTFVCLDNRQVLLGYA